MDVFCLKVCRVWKCSKRRKKKREQKQVKERISRRKKERKGRTKEQNAKGLKEQKEWLEKQKKRRKERAKERLESKIKREQSCFWEELDLPPLVFFLWICQPGGSAGSAWMWRRKHQQQLLGQVGIRWTRPVLLQTLWSPNHAGVFV